MIVESLLLMIVGEETGRMYLLILVIGQPRTIDNEYNNDKRKKKK